MKDLDKTKSQLIEELIAMRSRVAELERESTEKKVRGEVMQQSEEYLRLVIEATNDGIWDWNVKTGQAHFSPRYYTMLGYEPDEFPSTYDNWRQLIHPDDLEATENVVQQALEEGTSYAVEFRMKTKNEGWRWILSRGKAIEVDSEGKFVRMFGTHQDISKRKQIEDALRLTQFIYEVAPIGIWRLGVDGLILDANNQAIDNFGYLLEELRCMTVFDCDPEITDELWNDLVTDFSHRTFETRHKRKDGKIFPVQVTVKMVRFGKDVFHIAFFQDITDRKKMEVEREELITELQAALAEIKELRGILPICSKCKKIRNDQGYWTQIESYIHEHSNAEFSHGLCPDCAKKLYPELYE